METILTSDGKLQVTEIETRTKVSIHDYDFLLSQRKAVQAQKDEDNIRRDKELSEIDILISECEKLGLKSKEVPANAIIG